MRSLTNSLILLLTILCGCLLLLYVMSLTCLPIMSGVDSEDFIDARMNEPRKAYENLIQNPVPGFVKNLEGGGYTWQGHCIYLQFTANKDFIKWLSEDGYKQTTWAEISGQFALPDDIVEYFSSPWLPGTVQNGLCLKKDNLANAWTHSGSHYVIVDTATYVVYFVGIGS
jgi:hypothetical protein